MKARIIGAVFAAALHSAAVAQLTVNMLNPAGANFSEGYAVRDGQQVGGSNLGASLWSGTAGSWVNLNPTGAQGSAAYGVDSGIQVGYANIGGNFHAALWSGTAASFVDLHPAGAAQSSALAVGGGQQAGYVQLGGVTRAAFWSGTAASFVDLAPAGATYSQAYGISGPQQAGVAMIGGVTRAGFWTGTAASWVDLNPAGATGSQAYAVHNGVQVGEAYIGGIPKAGMWTSTAGSWVDLSPPGATESVAKAIFGNAQVGRAVVAGVQRASLWNGSAGTWVDLHPLVPSHFASSDATGVWKNGNTLYIVGHGYSLNTFGMQAILWVGTIDNFGFVLNKVQVAGQNSVQGTIAIPDPRAVPTVFTTYDNSSLVNTPPNVTILTGQLFRNFQITTTAVNSPIQTTVYAKRGALTRSQPLLLVPLVPTALAFTPSQVSGGNPVSCRVVINGVAGPGGRVIATFDNSPYATTPSTVTVPPGGTDVTFAINTLPVTNTKFVTVTARVSAGEKSGTFRINP